MYWQRMDVLALVFGFVVLVVFLGNRAKYRSQRLKVIEEAIRRGNLEQAAQDELVRELTGRRVQRPRSAPAAPGEGSFTSFARWVFVGGWIGLFVGIALLIGAGATGDDEVGIAGGIIGAISFGVMSLPFALRELDRRTDRLRA